MHKSFRLWAALILVVGSAVLVCHAEDSRLEAARADLEAAKQTLNEVTEPRDKEIWGKRVEVLETEIANIQRLAELEKKEAAATASRNPKTEQEILVETLSSIDTSTTELENKRNVLTREIQQLNLQRTIISDQLKGKTAVTDEEIDRQAELEQQGKNLDARILASTFDRDKCDMGIRVRTDAVRIKKYLDAQEWNPKLSIRILLSKRSMIAASADLSNAYQTQAANLRAQREETAAWLALARERIGQVNNEYENLRQRYAIEKKTSATISDPEQRSANQKRLMRMLSSSKFEARMLEPRIKFLEAQVASLDETIALADKGSDLVNQEVSFLYSEYNALRQRYTRQMMILLSIIASIMVLDLVIEQILIHRSRKEQAFVARRLTRYLCALLVLIVLTFFFFEDLRAIATILGLATAAVVIALQDLCSSFVGWFVIVMSSKMKIGDRVEINGIMGDILDIQILRTTILETGNWLQTGDHTGRVVIIPNNFIFKHHVFNYSYLHPMIWERLDILVTFETPPKEAEDVLTAILQEESRETLDLYRKGDENFSKYYHVAKSKREPKVLCTIGDSGILFSLFFPAHFRGASSFKSRLSKRIVEEFAKRPQIQFAYPTQRLIPTPEGPAFKVQMAQGIPPGP